MPKKNIPNWVDSKLNWVPLPVPDMPPRVLVDFATKCNLRCAMCPVWGADDEAINSVKGLMALEKARKLIDEISVAKPLVQPCLYGEPLVAPNIREHIEQIKSKGMSFALNTNGLELTTDMAKFLVDQKIDSVMISIDAVTPETLKKIRGIRKLARIENSVLTMLAERGSLEYPRIGVSFTIQEENKHEVNDFVKRWVGVVDVVRTGLVFENGKFTELVAPKKRVPCPVIYKTMPIHNDGEVTVCCLDGLKTTKMGNVFHEGVRNVWHGEEFTKMRYYHETAQWDKVQFCKDCNGWAQYEYEEEIRDEILIRKSPEFTYYNKISRISNWHTNLHGGHSVLSTKFVEKKSI